MADGYYLSENDAVRVKRMLTAFEEGRLNPALLPAAARLGPPVETRLGRTLQAIPAAHLGSGSGLYAGSGPGELYSIGNPDGLLGDAGLGVTVWNPGRAGIPAGAMVGLLRDPTTGNYFTSPLPAGQIVVPLNVCLEAGPNIVVEYGVIDLASGQVVYTWCVTNPTGCCISGSGSGSGSGVSNGCCPDMPLDLCLTLSGVSGSDCSCMEGVTVDLTWNAAVSGWIGYAPVDPACGNYDSNPFVLRCPGTGFSLTNESGSVGGIASASFDCNPLSIVFADLPLFCNASALSNGTARTALVVAGSCGGGGGGPDCCAGNCGDPGVAVNLTATVTNATGCFASLASPITFTCANLAPFGHFWTANNLLVCGVTQSLSISYCPSGPLDLNMADIAGNALTTTAQSGWTCNPFSAVFFVNDGAGNTCTVTVT